eukprot:4897967-Amphidinium_carterae.1
MERTEKTRMRRWEEIWPTVLCVHHKKSAVAAKSKATSAHCNAIPVRICERPSIVMAPNY